MTLQTISPLPTAPSRDMDSATFVSAADAMLAALVTMVSQINSWSAAVPGEVNPANLNATSTTSVAVGTGSKTFTVETNKLFVVGVWLVIASTASPSNYMVGQVTAYNDATGALAVSVAFTSGSGTFASWAVGPTPSPNQSANIRAVTDAATTGTITPTSATADLYIVTGATGSLTFAAPSGTPVDGQKLMLRFKDNGTSRALSWNTIYRAFGSVALPAATTLGKWHYVGMVYCLADAKWDCVAHSVQQ